MKPTTVVIFGASGDLTQRKLVPALYNLHRKERIPATLNIVGFARRPWDDVCDKDRRRIIANRSRRRVRFHVRRHEQSNGDSVGDSSHV